MLDVFQSPPFKFIVEGHSLYIHADLASTLSRPFDRMINGEMAEAKEGSAILENVDQGTFVRFIQWAYKGYYDATKYCNDSIEDDEGVVPACDERSATNNDVAAKKTPEKQSKRDVVPPRANKHANENYKEVFLCHARLYVFTEQYDVQALRMLALEELHAALANFTLWDTRTGDIVALFRYVYANTTESPIGTIGAEDLRSLLAQYLGFEMDTMIKDDDFRDLTIEEGGDLLGDFMKMVSERI